MKTTKLTVYIFLFLILATYTLKTFAPLIINFVILLTISFILYNITLKRNRLFDFVLIIYAASFFQYGNNIGGTFNLVALITLSINFFSNAITRRKFQLNLRIGNPLILFLITILMLSNFLGLFFKNKSELIGLIFGITSFTAFIAIFLCVSNIHLNKIKIRKFIAITNIFFTYSLLLSLGKFFGLLKSELPLLGFSGKVFSDNLAGSFGSSAIGAEAALIYYLLVFPFLIFMDTRTDRYFRNHAVYGVFIASLSILLAGSRSVIILSVFATIIIFAINQFSLVKRLTNKSRMFFGVCIIISVIFVLGPILNLSSVMTRLSLIDTNNITYEGVTEGYGINRIDAMKFGYLNLVRESWWIGYGWGTLESNRQAWFGDSEFYREDPHSIYLSLPMIWGWIGGTSFILVIVYFAFKSFILVIGPLPSELFYIPLTLSLSLIWILFLVNEYKISAMSFSNYFMIIWIYLGLTFAIIKNNNNASKG